MTIQKPEAVGYLQAIDVEVSFLYLHGVTAFKLTERHSAHH
jgi:hypothetical protein